MSQPICREIGEASELLAFLANPDRLAILCLLLEGERTVMQLEVALSLRQPSLSQQIGILRRAKLIEGRREARQVVYRLSDRRVEVLIGTLRGIFADLIPASALAVTGQDRAAMTQAVIAARLAEREWM
jgi:DNA-binding transcriptional ArsR family regulator